MMEEVPELVSPSEGKGEVGEAFSEVKRKRKREKESEMDISESPAVEASAKRPVFPPVNVSTSLVGEL